MAVRFYFVPKAGTGTTDDLIRPKYIADLGVRWSGMDYGLENVFFVGADVTNGEHTTIANNSDVVSVPANLDGQVGGALNTVQNSLEALNLPAGWVTATHTYREILSASIRILLLMQRFRGREKRRFFESGITLGTLVSDLTQAQRNALSNAAQSLGLDTSAVTGSMTIRQALKLVSEQISIRPILGVQF